MVKGLGSGGGDVAQVIDQLERFCLAPDGSLISKSTYYHLQLAREEMMKERQRYLEAMTVYVEAMSMVEEFQQSVSVANLGGIRDMQGLGLTSSPQVYETLEHRLMVSEAAQRLRLPLISKDGDIYEEDIEKWSIMSRSSLDSTSTVFTAASSLNSTNHSNVSLIGAGSTGFPPSIDASEPEIGGVPNRFLGLTPSYLWQVQLHQTPLSMDMSDYQIMLSREIGHRLDDKCNKVADAIAIDDIDSSTANQTSFARLPERDLLFLFKESIPFTNDVVISLSWMLLIIQLNRVKLITEEIEREEAAWREDLYSLDRKFSEYYNVLEQMLGVLIKLVKDIKLQHQHKYDDLHKTWLIKRCETMNAKLRVLEHILLLETYTKETIPALHKIRYYLIESTEEASLAYNKAITRLSEYQGVDPHFDQIARQYHDIVKKLENMQWTIHQVEMDLKRMPDHPGNDL
ncbi:hypothetical protein LIER_00418 [Lithospermum erythrorhizon]|uniref:AUGMIN subunit 4 n=1 Tax=Lithospermum erythrorhizon TaxID=34254 RepID=A0AAV3NHA0_LITER